MKLNHLVIALILVNVALVVVLIARGTESNAAPVAQPVLRAQLIELVDSRGVVRGQLKTEDDGEVVLRLRDQRGNIRVKLGAGDTGSGLLLADDQTDVGVQIQSGISSATQQRSTMITLADPRGVKRVIRPGE
jgi:hypothetical protein